ncbi:hypothetical protein K435DRAFT_559516, partial [Dendrothele bispora CBS 962.96]
STSKCIFEKHYIDKASKARSVAQATFAVSPMVGSIPPKDGIQLYMARIDPHLTFGCKIAIDVDEALVSKLEAVQHSFLRRLLGLNSHSMLVVLFTETGLVPIRYRRLQLALSYLKYAASCSKDHLAFAAFSHCCSLHRKGASSLIGDIIFALACLPVPVNCTLADCSVPERIDHMSAKVLQSWESSAMMFIQGSVCCHLLRNRIRVDPKGLASPEALITFRHYLTLIPTPKHRRAFVRFLTSGHRLGVELLRHTDRRYRPAVPREWRKCRFGCEEVEDEFHATLRC